MIWRPLALLCALSALPAARALACSAPNCSDSFLLPASGSVPANMVQLLYTPARSSHALDAGDPTPRLYRREGGTEVSVPFTTTPLTDRSVWITPMEPQPVGSQLVLEADPGGCMDRALHAELSVSEAAPIPTTLGTLAVQVQRDVLTVAVVNGSCDGPIDAAYADLTVQLSESAAPYAALLRYQLIVDGEQRAPFSSSLVGGEGRPHGQARFYAVCDKDDWISPSDHGVGVGRHQVHMNALLPDGTALRTDDVEVELRCDGAEPARADAGQRVDAGLADAGSPSAAGDDGCALAGRRDGAWVLALAMFLLRRRRR